MRRTRVLLGVCVLIGAEALGAAAGTPLIEAVKAGDRAAIRRLARDRAAVTASEPDGTTPLHWAVDMGCVGRTEDRVAVVQALVAAGADLEAVGFGSRTVEETAYASNTEYLIPFLRRPDRAGA